MALLACLDCSTRFAVGLSRCPHCQSEHFEEDTGMSPKITVHGGPSIAGASVVAGGWSSEGDPDVWPEPEQADDETAVEGSEEPSAGSSSETSPEKPSSEPETSGKPRRSPARTTASRSKKAATGDSSARSTDGGQTEPTSAADS